MLIIEQITSTSGTVFKRAEINAKCCKRNSISKSEDGSLARWPIVRRDLTCSGGRRRRFQPWVDNAVKFYGLCVSGVFSRDGWLYMPKGMKKIRISLRMIISTCKIF